MTSPWKRPLDFKLQASPCPRCGAMLDGAGTFAGPIEPPNPGDLTVCIYCAGLLRFGVGLALEAVEGDELILALADPDVRSIRDAVRRLLKERRRR